MGIAEDFNSYRRRMNEKIMESDSLIIKRIFNLDTNAYAEGHLDIRSIVIPHLRRAFEFWEELQHV